jgi:hypothetical protein
MGTLVAARFGEIVDLHSDVRDVFLKHRDQGLHLWENAEQFLDVLDQACENRALARLITACDVLRVDPRGGARRETEALRARGGGLRSARACAALRRDPLLLVRPLPRLDRRADLAGGLLRVALAHEVEDAGGDVVPGARRACRPPRQH